MISRNSENGAVEQRAIEAIGSALEDTDRPLVVTSGIALLALGRVATEQTPLRPALRFLPPQP